MKNLKSWQPTKKNGDCNIPQRDGNLGVWLGNQRKAKNKISADRRQRLESIGFIWNLYEGK